MILPLDVRMRLLAAAKERVDIHERSTEWHRVRVAKAAAAVKAAGDELSAAEASLLETDEYCSADRALVKAIEDDVAAEAKRRDLEQHQPY